MLTNRKGSEVDANNLDLLLGELGNHPNILLADFLFHVAICNMASSLVIIVGQRI